MLAIPEGKAVVKSFGLLIGELKLPVLAAVFCFVDARLLSRPGSQNEGGFVIEGLNVAEIQRFRA